MLSILDAPWINKCCWSTRRHELSCAIGCTDGSADQDELDIGEAIEVYEAVRWPDGKMTGGKA